MIVLEVDQVEVSLEGSLSAAKLVAPPFPSDAREDFLILE